MKRPSGRLVIVLATAAAAVAAVAGVVYVVRKMRRWSWMTFEHG